MTDRDRAIAVIATLVSQNVTDARLVNYLASPGRNGLDENGLTELMVLLAACVGQPYTSVAMETVRRSAADSEPPAWVRCALNAVQVVAGVILSQEATGSKWVRAEDATRAAHCLA
ncbi:MAG: hypothetical protein L0H96_18565 [Humibacillus sp.]|nr:hypothetical protein [Humibacillus sp.]MDN5778902.1 hypothetical protein [Humibacillus sp.]